ncbi:MAG: hypothetical protein U0T11_08610 [Chitinophagaceae bacterium]
MGWKMVNLKQEDDHVKKSTRQENSQGRLLTLDEQLDQFADIIIDIYLETEHENESSTKQSDCET